MLKYKVRFIEPFKDGSIFGSRAFKANEVAIIDENEATRARNSGAMFDIQETLVPNPLKNLPQEPERVVITGTFTNDPVNQNVISPVVNSTLDDVRPQKKVVLDDSYQSPVATQLIADEKQRMSKSKKAQKKNVKS